MFATDAIVEFVGTAFFVSIILATGGQPWAVGAALAGAIWIGGLVGCQSNNFNPAVSVALFARGAMPAWRCAGYVVAQVLGGLLAFYLMKANGGKLGKWVHHRQ